MWFKENAYVWHGEVKTKISSDEGEEEAGMAPI